MKTKDAIKERNKAHIRYKLKDGTPVPGVTTVVGSWGENKGALTGWAYNMGLDGYDMRAYTKELAKIGTLAHAMVTEHLQNATPNLDDYSPLQITSAKNSFQSFLAWQKSHRIDELLLVEAPIVSELHGYGGTIDIYGVVDGVWELDDVKTGNIYESHFIQTVAYAKSLMEHGNLVQRIRILSIPRTEDESFQEVIVTNIDEWFEIFLSLLRAYKIHKEIKEGTKMLVGAKKKGGKKNGRNK